MKRVQIEKKFIKTCSFGSLIGTTIEFFDFYIMPTPPFWFFLVFPSADSTNSVLLSLATFSIAFLSRPLGSAVFGHYGEVAKLRCFIDDGYFNSFHWFYLVMPASESLLF
jgi:hypothetical protein